MRLILCYHALADENVCEPDPEGVLTGLANAVRLSQFSSQLDWLESHADVLTLDELVGGSERGNRSTKIAITFDDGYRSVVRLGLPLLREKQFPIAWFITSAFTRSRHNLPWWDLLVRLYALKPKRILLSIGGDDQEFALDDRCGLKAFQAKMNQVFYGANQELKAQVIGQLLSKVNGDGVDVRNDIASPDEIVSALKAGYLELGGHSATHLNMGLSSSNLMLRELSENRAFVTELAGKAPEWFAYPYGGEAHIAESAVEMVKRVGYSGAVTATARHVSLSSDPFLIPRITVQPGWDMKKFVLSVRAPLFAKYLAKSLAAMRRRPC